MSKIMNSTNWMLLGLVGCATGLVSAGCSEPTPKCTAGRGDWTVVYTSVKSGDASCADTPLEIYGMQVYNPSKADHTPDLSQAKVAIQSTNLGSAAQYVIDYGTEQDAADVASQKWYAFGAFATNEPEADFCQVPTFAPAKLDAPAVVIPDDPSTPADESAASAPATSIEYDWSNVEFYVTTASLGTVMRGDVKITVDGAACEYSAVGVYYSVYCGSTVMQPVPDVDDPSKVASCAADTAACDLIGTQCDANNNCTPCHVNPDDPNSTCTPIGASCVGIQCEAPVACTDASECAAYNAICNGSGECEKADQQLCSPSPDPDHGYPTGSGIDPAVPMKCDEATMMCVPDGTPPQLQ